MIRGGGMWNKSLRPQQEFCQQMKNGHSKDKTEGVGWTLGAGIIMWRRRMECVAERYGFISSPFEAYCVDNDGRN